MTKLEHKNKKKTIEGYAEFVFGQQPVSSANVESKSSVISLDFSFSLKRSSEKQHIIVQNKHVNNPLINKAPSSIC